MAPKFHPHLLAVLQLDQHAVVVRLGYPLREAARRLDEHLERPVQQLVHLAVVVVVVADAVDALDVVPDGAPKLGRVDVGAAGDRVVRQVVRRPELFVQVEADVVVQSARWWGENERVWFRWF